MTSGLGGSYPGGLVIGMESVRTGDDGLARYVALKRRRVSAS